MGSRKVERMPGEPIQAFLHRFNEETKAHMEKARRASVYVKPSKRRRDAKHKRLQHIRQAQERERSKW